MKQSNETSKDMNMSTYFQGLKDRFSITASNLPEGVKARLLEDKPELEWPLDLVRELDRLEDTYLDRDIHDTDAEFVTHLIEFLKEAEFQIQEELAGWRDLHSYMLVNNYPKETKVKADTLTSKEEYEQAPLGTRVELVGCPGLIWKKNHHHWVTSAGDTLTSLSPRERRVIRWGKNLNTTTASF